MHVCLTDPFERPDSSFLYANGHTFLFKNADFANISQNLTTLSTLHNLPVQVNDAILPAGEAMQSIGLDPSILNPEVCDAQKFRQKRNIDLCRGMQRPVTAWARCAGGRVLALLQRT
jgi:hypothetical protein